MQLQVVKAASFKLLAKTLQKLSNFENSYLCYQMVIFIDYLIKIMVLSDEGY